jgi:hypothetical protein
MSCCPSATLPQDTKLTEKKSFDLAALKLKVRPFAEQAAARTGAVLTPFRVPPRAQKAKEMALQPGKSFMMTAFMLWMSGSGVHPFSMMITFYAGACAGCRWRYGGVHPIKPALLPCVVHSLALPSPPLLPASVQPDQVRFDRQQGVCSVQRPKSGRRDQGRSLHSEGASELWPGDRAQGGGMCFSAHL